MAVFLFVIVFVGCIKEFFGDGEFFSCKETEFIEIEGVYKLHFKDMLTLFDVARLRLYGIIDWLILSGDFIGKKFVALSIVKKGLSLLPSALSHPFGDT